MTNKIAPALSVIIAHMKLIEARTSPIDNGFELTWSDDQERKTVRIQGDKGPLVELVNIVKLIISIQDSKAIGEITNADVRLLVEQAFSNTERTPVNTALRYIVNSVYVGLVSIDQLKMYCT